MTSQPDPATEVTITLTGERARYGLALTDLESFAEAFVRALRDFDRAKRGAETRKSGHPERRAEAAAAFRLVRLEPGSAVATLVADPEIGSDEQLALGDTPLALQTLADLMSDVAAEREIPDDVLDDLDRARRACGNDGAIGVDLPRQAKFPGGRVVIDRAVIERLNRPRSVDPASVTSISGRLYSVNLEPDRLAIRATDGVEWACRYAQELEPRVRALLGEVVWAAGEGRLTSSHRGSMRVEQIQAAVQGRQTELFVNGHPTADEVLARQGRSEPQGLDGLSGDAWMGDEADERYLASMLGEV